MKPALQREEALFQAASQLTGAERATFLNGACLGDDALRQRLAALLAAHDAPDELSPAPAARATIKLDLAEAPDEAVGQTLGRYKLLERVGEGGCGVVYVAEQTEPVRRRVALKVIKLGMDTKQVVARFEAERQALAMMDHPNIAKVLDAGTTDVGRPYFVMELVRGIRITDYCDQANLSTKERLDLFIKVCQAIQHAHQKGIIHRDIKPSNILVTLHDGVPVPKVIDFGIAKATEGRLTDATVYTQLNQFIGTPAYMSPEQAEMSGLDIDTRSDIYSLGVLLYELLAGSTPFDAQELMSQGIDQMRKTIREVEPPRPSTRFATLKGEDLTTTAKRRSADTSKLMHQLKGDLDWIVMKCLEKDRTRRYDTATGLAADIKRHLNNEPVVARPPSTAYRFQKAFRRNKISFAAGAIVIVALLLGIIATTWQAVRAEHAKHEALAAKAGESVQRQKAEANELQAISAQANEARLREQAETAELAARQRAYASDINLVQQALANNNLGRAQDLLDRQKPKAGQQDLRGWEWRYFWQQCRSEASFTVCQKTNQINSVVASADGRWLAESERDEPVICVWDLRTRQQIVRLPTGLRPVFDFSKREPLLAYSEVTGPETNRQYRVILWNPATRQKTGEIPVSAWRVSFAADGQTLGISTFMKNYYQTVSVWRVADQKQLLSREGPQVSNQSGCAFSPDLGLFAYCWGDRLHLLDLKTGRECWTNVLVNPIITTLAFSPDGKVLASGEGFAASPVSLWDVATGKKLGVAEGHSGWVSSLAFWPDGKTLASGSGDQTIRLWDVSDPARPRSKRILRGHRGEVWSLSLLADGVTLFSGAKDGSVCSWDTASAPANPSHMILPERVDEWEFGSDADGDFIAAWESLPGQPEQGVEWKGANFLTKGTQWNTPTNIPVISILPGGQRLFSISTNGSVKVFSDWRSQQQVHEFTVGDISKTLVVCPESFQKMFTLNQDDGSLSAWDLTTGNQLPLGRVDLEQLGEAGFYDYSEFFAPNDQWAILPQGKNQFLLINVLTGQKTLVAHNVRQHITESQGCAFSPDGNLFAMGSYEGYLKIWEVASWREVGTLHGWIQSPHSVTFSPDGRRIAVGGDGNEAVKLFDTNTREELVNFSADGSLFSHIKFSADGNILGARNAIGNLNLWRAPTWEEINAADAKEKTQSQQP